MSKHYANAIVFHCADDRYQNQRDFAAGLQAILEDAQAVDRFPQTNFGSSLVFKKPSWHPALRDTLNTAEKLGIKRVILIDHMDCGAFQLEYGKMTPEEERQKHIESLALAKGFLAKHAPRMKVTRYLQDFNEFEIIQ